ncbi:ABC transporter permease [uncultured Enterovirga sp.]|uniref:ABC transporter permease n=1 Tax=uncultured Enterovirga sp. TaxID=2026352 RepID=UPI0035C9F849
MDQPFLTTTFSTLLGGLPLTLQLFALSVVSGGLLAVLLVWMRQSGPLPFRWLYNAFVFVFRGTPLLIQLFLIYYGLSQFPDVRSSLLWPFLRDPFWCSVLALALNTAAYSSEIFRGALLAVPRGQVEAARACGMSELQVFRSVVFPVSLRLTLPPYASEVILMTKATALASIVTLNEVMFLAQKLSVLTYRAIEVLLCAGVIYLVLNIIIARAFSWLEHRLSPYERPAVGLGQSALGLRPELEVAR